MTKPSYPVSTIAKLFNLTERRVQQLAKDGIIPKSNKGKYELVSCVQGYIHYLQERAMGKDSAPQDTYTERARLLKAQADKTELEVGTLKGNLLQIDQVESSWANMVTSCKSRLLTIPSKSAHQIALLTKPQEIERFLKHSIYEALEELGQESDNYDDSEITASEAKSEESLSASTRANSKSVGRRTSTTKPRGKCRTRKMDNG